MGVVPTPATFASGLATSTQLNSGVRDALNFLLTPPSCRARQTVAQSLTTAVWGALLWDTEDVDKSFTGGGGAGGMAVPSTQYTAVYAGWYQVAPAVAFAGNVTNRRGIRLAVNAVVVSGSAAIYAASSASGITLPDAADLVFLAVGDILEAYAFQDSGGALNTVVSAESMPRINITWRSL